MAADQPQRDDELARLATESRNQASARIDELSASEIVRVMNDEDASVAAAVATQSDAIAVAIDRIVDAFRQGGRLIYIGAGTSGRLGVLDASECPPTFSTPPEMVVGLIAGGRDALTRAIEGAEDHPEAGERDVRAVGLNRRDVLCGIATSGRTPYVLGALRYAGELPAFRIGFSCNPDSELNQHSDLSIAPVVGPEIVTGSTRLKAGTATKMVLNMLTTGALIRLGKTFGNLMVDLTATNNKLKERSKRIVSELTDLSFDEAAKLLDACDGELKTAIVANLQSVGPDEARALLDQADGHLRRAIERADS